MMHVHGNTGASWRRAEQTLRLLSSYLYEYYLFFSKHHVINHKGNWLGTLLGTFWLNKICFTTVGFEHSTSDWRAGALPTELTIRILAVSLFCQYLCSCGGGGGVCGCVGVWVCGCVGVWGGGAPVRSHETTYCPLARDHTHVTIQPGKRKYGDAP